MVQPMAKNKPAEIAAPVKVAEAKLFLNADAEAFLQINEPSCDLSSLVNALGHPEKIISRPSPQAKDWRMVESFAKSIMARSMLVSGVARALDDRERPGSEDQEHRPVSFEDFLSGTGLNVDAIIRRLLDCSRIYSCQSRAATRP